MDAFAEVRIVLAECRDDGMPFRSAWYRALRQLMASEGEAAEIAAEIEEDRAMLREVMPHYKAAYERRPVLPAERRKVKSRAEKRLADLDVDELARAA